MAASPLPITGLRDIADRYDAFFIDQFGVLHDGITPYPGAVAALEELKQAGRKIIILSNSGKRSAPNAARLTRLGFPAGSWTYFLSSGEVAWSILAALPVESGRRPRCLLLARDGDHSATDDLPLDLTDTAEDCDLILIAGSEGDTRQLDAYRSLLAPAAARGVPAYCTNPDKQMLTPMGLRFGAGRIAEAYVELGGEVHWIGKPFPAIYAAACARIADIDPARILCIGDSVEHDIAGARGAGLASCLVRTGIHADATPAQRDLLYSAANARPDFIAPDFRW